MGERPDLRRALPIISPKGGALMGIAMQPDKRPIASLNSYQVAVSFPISCAFVSFARALSIWQVPAAA